jgi:ABC-2 type transport system permease protein
VPRIGPGDAVRAGYDSGLMGADSQTLVVVHQREPFLRGFGAFVTDSWTSRTILMSFVRKELLVRYRASALGILWAMAKPLTQLLIYGVVIGVFLGVGDRIPAYGIYMFTGLIMMGIFSESSTNGATSILRGAPLVKKVAFRRELLPVASVGGALVNAMFTFAVLCMAYVVSGSGPNWGQLFYAVPALLIVVLFASGMALLLSALNVYARDTQFVVEVGLMMLFWLTPVVYSWTTVRDAVEDSGLGSWVFELYMLNPMANAVIAFRDAFWPGINSPEAADLKYFDSPFAARLWMMVLAGAFFLWLSQRLFARMQAGFAAEL